MSYVITYGVFFIATYMLTFVIFWEKKKLLVRLFPASRGFEIIVVKIILNQNPP